MLYYYIRIAALGLTLGAGAAAAEVPHVVTDIAPVHGLVSRVMQGVGTPALVIPQTASPHDYQLRPSAAANLQKADLVVWIGPRLTPWMPRALENLAMDARTVQLNGLEQTQLLPFREEFGPVDDHDHDHEGDNDGDTVPVDPHTWLDPGNAAAWVVEIAKTLGEMDPENAALYAANAQRAVTELATRQAALTEVLAPYSGQPYIVFHDAYQYFEAAFGVAATGAIALSDAVDPSPARVAELRDTLREMDVECVFAEPQFDPKLIAVISEGAQTRVGILDPLGSALELGPAFYTDLMTKMAESLQTCFSAHQ